jgi:hypothetical protein
VTIYASETTDLFPIKSEEKFGHFENLRSTFGGPDKTFPADFCIITEPDSVPEIKEISS